MAEGLETSSPALLRMRKKGSGAQVWLLIDGHGSSKVLQAGKHAIMRRAGLPARDMRILDPLLSHSSTILGRERAIVVHLEHIRVIITAEEVMVLKTQGAQAATFADELQRRIESCRRIATDQQLLGILADDDKKDVAKITTLSPSLLGSSFDLQDEDQATAYFPESSVSKAVNHGGSPLHAGASAQLPFEFQALEICLEAVCRYLDLEACQLIAMAYPALDELTTNISTLNLQRVRQIKSRLVGILGRVQKVRDEIEQLLDDDRDMAEMYLSEKLLRQELEGPFSPNFSDIVTGKESTSQHEEDSGIVSRALLADKDNALDSSGDDESSVVDSAVVTSCTSSFDNEEATLCSSHTLSFSNELCKRHPTSGLSYRATTTQDSNSRLHHGHGGSSIRTSRSSGGRSKRSKGSSGSRNLNAKVMDVEDLEMLLEAYLVQIDCTLNKLSALEDYVDDTEDYINIMLDDKQNNLLRTGLMLTTATLILGAFVVVTGVFGMNIEISMFDSEGPESYFYWVVGGCCLCSAIIYMVVIGFWRQKGVLQ